MATKVKFKKRDRPAGRRHKPPQKARMKWLRRFRPVAFSGGGIVRWRPSAWVRRYLQIGGGAKRTRPNPTSLSLFRAI